MLNSAMTAIDQASSTVDHQHVLIQKQFLLGQNVLAETLLRLKSSTASNAVHQLKVADIRSFLQVEPVVNTNLVEIRAEGNDPEFLSQLIDTCIDVYLDARAEQVKKLTTVTASMIISELAGLYDKKSAKRTELENFAKVNGISSTERVDNEPLAKLNGLNDSLNKASEEEIKSKAFLDAVKLAISRNEALVPEQEQGSLQDLEKRLLELKEKLAEFDKKYTREYLAKQPSLKMIPEQIKTIEAEINHKLEYGKQIILTEAKNNYAAAKQTVIEIRSQLDEHKKQSAEFSSKFTQYEALKTDLDGLEKLYRDTQERLVQVQTSHKEEYPQVTVINRAYSSKDPVRPDYNRDALIALLVSLFFSLFVVWIVEFLTRKEQPHSAISLNRIHMYQGGAADLLDHHQGEYLFTDPSPTHSLSSSLFRELSVHQMKILLDAANLKGKQIIALLLTGLSLDEAASLKAEQLDFHKATITISGSAPRTLALNSALKALFARSGNRPVWDTDKSVSSNDLAAVLLCSAVDSGLDAPCEITSEAIRHSYIAYLIRQGIRLNDLEQITGYLEPAEISEYSFYPTVQKDHGIDHIELVHPALDSIT